MCYHFLSIWLVTSSLLIHSFIHVCIPSLLNPFVIAFVHSIIQWLILLWMFVHFEINCVRNPFLLIDSLTQRFTHSVIHWFVYWFTLSFNHSFVITNFFYHSFIHSLTHVLYLFKLTVCWHLWMKIVVKKFWIIANHQRFFWTTHVFKTIKSCFWEARMLLFQKLNASYNLLT